MRSKIGFSLFTFVSFESLFSAMVQVCSVSKSILRMCFKRCDPDIRFRTLCSLNIVNNDVISKGSTDFLHLDLQVGR